LHVRSLFPVLFSLFPQVPPPYILIFGERDSRPKKHFPTKRKNARRVSKHRKKRDGRRWQQRWWPECGSASFFFKGATQPRKKERKKPPVDGHVDWAHILCRWKW